MCSPPPGPPVGAPQANSAGHVVIVGFGPAGQAVGCALADRDEDVVVPDLDPRAIDAAGDMGLIGQIGDATQVDVLRHAGMVTAGTVVVTVPGIAARIVRLVRATDVHIVSRARCHMYVDERCASGADELADEALTGHRLAANLRRHLARLGNRNGE